MTTLYRFLDEREVLLYVGITDDFTRRLKEHEDDKVWFGRVKVIRLREYGSRARAARAEREAIKIEKPLHNRQGNPESVYAQNRRLFDSILGRPNPDSGRQLRVIKASDIAIEPGPRPWRMGEDPYEQ